jgi:hypothetical protein
MTHGGGAHGGSLTHRSQARMARGGKGPWFRHYSSAAKTETHCSSAARGRPQSMTRP